MSRTLLALRLALRVAGPRLLVRILPTWAMVGFLLVQLHDVLDWAAISRWLISLGPALAALVVLGIAGAWSAAWVPAVRASVHGRDLDFLWRQPLARPARAAVVAPFAALVTLPGLLPAPLAAGPSPGWSAPGWLALAALVSVAVVGAGVALPPIAPWLPTVPGRARTPLGALLRRDAHALLREEPRALVAALLPVVPVALSLEALRSHGGVSRRGLALGALVFLAFSAPLGFLPVHRLVHRLGERLDPPAWPVRPRLRALALVAVGCAAFTPAWAGTLAVGPSAAPLAVAYGAGAAWLSVSRAGFGAWLWWTLAALGLAALPDPAGWIASLGAGVLATAGTAASLARRRP